MKLAMVLASDLHKSNWICHFFCDSRDEIDNLGCVSPGVMTLPKDHYPGEIDETPVIKRSCVTGMNSEYRIVTIDASGLKNKYNLL